MRYFASLFLSIVLFSFVSAQSSREEAIRELEALKERAKQMEQIVLQPSSDDLKAAELESVKVFRLLPRGKYRDLFSSVRGDGAYYSFVNQSHSYNDTPQIELQQGNLSVGFYGASYGFIADLGEIPLGAIDKKTKGVELLVNYSPPTEEAEARSEKRRRGLEDDGISYKESIPAAVGHSYVLRAVSFDEADALVAFKIHRKDADGSLIIFWKLIEQFEKPILRRADKSLPGTTVGTELREKVLSALQSKGFSDVTVDVSTVPITLRGTVPKGRLAEAIQVAQKATGKPIRNEVTEK